MDTPYPGIHFDEYNLPVALGLLGKKEEFLFFNRAFISICGYSVGEAINLAHWCSITSEGSIAAEAQLKLWRRNLQFLNKNNSSIMMELPIINKASIHKEVQITLAKSSNNTYLIYLEDVTIQTKITGDLRFEKDFNNLVTDSYDGLIILCDRNLDIVRTNEGIHTLLNYPSPDFSNSNLGSLLTTQSKFDFEKIAEACYKNHISQKCLLTFICHNRNPMAFTCLVKTIIKNEQVMLLLLAKIHVSGDDLVLSYGSNEPFEIFDNAPTVMLILNENREILRVNEQGRKLLGNNIENNAIGKVVNCINTLSGKYHCGSSPECSGCTIRKTVEETFVNKKPFHKIESKLLTSNGEKYILLSTSLITINNSQKLLATIEDITLRKALEKQLKLAKLNSDKSDRLKAAFLQNISHEIRTPLNGILGFSSLLNTEETTDDEKDFYLKIINDSSNQLLNMVDNILNLSRMDTEQIDTNLNSFNINVLLKNIHLEYIEKAKLKKIQLNLHLGLVDNKDFIYSDAQKIKIIYKSLLDNALKFTEHGAIDYGYITNSQTIEFFVKDTGIGIDKKHHEEIFDRFVKLGNENSYMYSGTGLGLTLTKGNIKLLGGNIWVESEINVGSTFWFTLNFNILRRYGLSNPTFDIKNTDPNIPTILIAEDEDINYLYMEQTLKNEGVRVIHAKNGSEAIKICESDKTICLVLMDIKMPEKDGYEALKEIRKIRPNLKVIAQTAYVYFSDKQKAFDAGFDSYISKPIRKEYFLGLVREFLQNVEK